MPYNDARQLIDTLRSLPETEWTWADRMFMRGFEQGWREGFEQGQRESFEQGQRERFEQGQRESFEQGQRESFEAVGRVAQRVAARSWGTLPASVSEQLGHIDDVQRMNVILDAVLSARTLEEFARALQ